MALRQSFRLVGKRSQPSSASYCLQHVARISASRTIRRDEIVDTAIEHYKSDTQTLARWLDVSIVKKKGRAFEADTALLPAKNATVFPLVKGYTLTLQNTQIPDTILQQALGPTPTSTPAISPKKQNIRLIAFSFKHYGFTLVRTWLTPFMLKYGGGPLASIPILEICFVEYGFLSLTKNVFASNLKTQIDPSQHSLTALSFGGVMDFAASLQLPNKYTGYVYLVDGKNRVRWRGCGACSGEKEMEGLYRVVEELKTER